MNDSRATIRFRAWVWPQEECYKEIEVWHHELEPIESGKRSVAEWALDHLSEVVDFHYRFNLDPEKYWQVLGIGELHGWWDYWGEYDEDFTVHDYQVEEISNTRELNAIKGVNDG